GGEDVAIVNGSDLAEKFDFSANGTRTHISRDLDGGSLDLGGGFETITLNALGGADTLTINGLTGVAPFLIILNLAATVGSTGGDGQADTVIVNGTNGADGIPVSGNVNGAGTGAVLVGGNAGATALPYFLLITSTEGSFDSLTVNALGGNDVVDASA